MIDNVIKLAKLVEVPLAERMGWHAVRQQGAFVVMKKEEEDRAAELLKAVVIASIMGANY